MNIKKRNGEQSPNKKRSAKKRRKSRVLESLSGTDAHSILKTLSERHANLAEEIDSIAEELLGDIDIEGVATDVKAALECLEPEDVWDRSGETRYGYVDPGEAAWEMFEETIEPFREEIEQYRKLGKLKEVNLYYQGILKGIYDFDKTSSRDYKDWAVDAPAGHFAVILKAWVGLPKGRLSLEEIQEFINEVCPDYGRFPTRMWQSRKSG